MLKFDVLPVYALNRGTIAEIESVVKDFFRESISDETLIIKFSTGAGVYQFASNQRYFN